jgi:hypothetical protein
VSDSGPDDGPASWTAASSTGAPPGDTTEGAATVASVDGTSSGDAPTTTMPLDGTSTTSASSDDPGSSSSGDGDTTTGEPGGCHPILAEVLFDAIGMNHRKQWVRIYNPCDVEIELAGAYVLAWGGPDYTHGQLELVGAIDPGECRVVGGPDSNNDNGNPVWGQNQDFSPDLQLGGDPADGVALFVGTAADVMSDTVPVDAVIYGVSNGNGLLDANGDTPAPHVGDVAMGQSIRRTSLAPAWEVAPSPTPNECPAL